MGDEFTAHATGVSPALRAQDGAADAEPPMVCDGCGREIARPGRWVAFIGGGKCHEWCVEMRNKNLDAKRAHGEWRDIATLPPPGDRPGRVWVLVEGCQHHSGACWYRRMAGIARTHNEGFEDEDIRRIEDDDHMDVGSGRVTHWLPIVLPLFPDRHPLPFPTPEAPESKEGE
jgi:hypothetical protein